MLLVLAATAVLGAGTAARALASYLVVPERLPAHADAIVVLGGGDRSGSRELQAAQLYQAGLAPVVITTGGPVAGEPGLATYADWSVQRLVRRGVPRRAVLATNEGDSTLTDAQGVLRLAQARGWHTLLVVTDSWHSRRTQLIFDDVFRDSSIAIYPSPARTTRFDPDAWWHDEDSAETLLTEYIKLGAYALAIPG